MKIGIFDPYLDDLGGGERYMMTIAECLSKRHEVVIFWDHKKDLKKIHDRFSLNLSRCQVKENIFSPTFGFTKRIYETLQYDVIMFLSDGSIPFVLSKNLYLHIQQPLAYMYQNSFRFKMKLSRVTKIFFNSKYSQSFVDPKIAVKGIVLYPPVELNPKKVKKENIILHVGRFRARNIGLGDYKKQDVMVSAFKQMVDQGLIGWRFVIAVSIHDEDQEEFHKMKNSAKGYPIDFLVNMTNELLWNVYSEAKIYWHASGFGEDLEKHPEKAEHFGISTVEAMGAGVVPVVIKAGGQVEIVEDKKSGFLWETIPQLIEKTKLLIENDALWKKLSSAAIQRSKKFEGDRFCREVTDLIQ